MSVFCYQLDAIPEQMLFWDMVVHFSVCQVNLGQTGKQGEVSCSFQGSDSTGVQILPYDLRIYSLLCGILPVSLAIDLLSGRCHRFCFDNEQLFMGNHLTFGFPCCQQFHLPLSDDQIVFATLLVLVSKQGMAK